MVLFCFFSLINIAALEKGVLASLRICNEVGSISYANNYVPMRPRLDHIIHATNARLRLFKHMDLHFLSYASPMHHAIIFMVRDDDTMLSVLFPYLLNPIGQW